MVSARSMGAPGVAPGVPAGGFPAPGLAAGKTAVLPKPFRTCVTRESGRPAALEDMMKRRLGRRSWLGVFRWPFRPWVSAPLTNLLVFLFSIINQTHGDLFSSEFVVTRLIQVINDMGFGFRKPTQASEDRKGRKTDAHTPYTIVHRRLFFNGDT